MEDAEAIKYLIDTVGRDVMSFRRNAQVSYLLLDRARDFFEGINAASFQGRMNEASYAISLTKS